VDSTQARKKPCNLIHIRDTCDNAFLGFCLSLCRETMNSSPSPQQPRLFLSHSSADKVFVRKLKGDLEKANLNVWLDETEIKVGDSIPQKVSEGLTDADYLVIVLSENSVKSKWVLAELDNALMAQYADRGVVVLPVKIDDCETPPLLKGRVYADFRTDYSKGCLVEKTESISRLANAG
jgi:hypothetical protein